MKPGGFDNIASIYDWLARLVFGNAIQQAQEYFLEDVPPQSKVLILGGGTGWLLTELLELKPQCEVWYVEASEKMLELSKTKVRNSDRVHFIHGTEDSISSEFQFDVMITNFYLDLFTYSTLDVVIQKIQNNLKPDSLCFVTDFVDGSKWWQSFLLKTMYRFFRTTCQIDATVLPDWNHHLSKQGFIKSRSKHFYSGFIEATVYVHNK